MFPRAPRGPCAARQSPRQCGTLRRCRRAAVFARSISGECGDAAQRGQRDARSFRIGIAVAPERAIRAMIPTSVCAHAREEKFPARNSRGRAAALFSRRAQRALERQNPQRRGNDPRRGSGKPRPAFRIFLLVSGDRLLKPVAPARFPARLAFQPCERPIQRSGPRSPPPAKGRPPP